MDKTKLKSNEAHAKNHRGKDTPQLDRSFPVLLSQHGPNRSSPGVSGVGLVKGSSYLMSATTTKKLPSWNT